MHQTRVTNIPEKGSREGSATTLRCSHIEGLGFEVIASKSNHGARREESRDCFCKFKPVSFRPKLLRQLKEVSIPDNLSSDVSDDLPVSYQNR